MLYSNAGFLTCVAPLGFTLAEVLVTLGIIGVVAALTMPSLVADYHEKATVVQVKRAYSIIQQAMALAYNEYGAPAGWENPNSDGLLDILSEKFKVTKTCYMSDRPCSAYPSPMGVITAFAMLADGSTLMIDWTEKIAQCNDTYTGVCGQITFDINGSKPPNNLGYDRFTFVVLKDRVIPRGTPGMPGTNDFNKYCLVKSPSFINEASSCTAWIIAHENMDYLHCTDISWNGKTKCD